MFAMTAAHPTLPIPSYARVTNPGNGRSVIVRVNDRGPFKDNRIIDLSYGAATRLGIASGGTAEVEVERLTNAQIASGEWRRGATPAGTPRARPRRRPSWPVRPRPARRGPRPMLRAALWPPFRRLRSLRRSRRPPVHGAGPSRSARFRSRRVRRTSPRAWRQCSVSRKANCPQAIAKRASSVTRTCSVCSSARCRTARRRSRWRSNSNACWAGRRLRSRASAPASVAMRAGTAHRATGRLPWRPRRPRARAEVPAAGPPATVA